MKPILEIIDLSILYNAKDVHPIHAVRDVSFSLFPNKTLALVGESGCGKSTTANALIRQIPKPRDCCIKGKVLFSGQDILSPHCSLFPKIGIVFQDPFQALNPTMKIGDQIIESFRLSDHQYGSKKEEVLKLLSLCEIPSPSIRYNQYPHQLSGGMRQRVVLAIALAMNPQILIADEPTTSLDVTTQKQILKLMKRIQVKTGCAILFISHDLAVVSQISDEICIMYGGKIFESGKTRKILSSPNHPYTKLLINAHPSISTIPSPIEGKSPNPAFPSIGCPFTNRCPEAMVICKKHLPPHYTDHECACHLFHQEARKR